MNLKVQKSFEKDIEKVVQKKISRTTFVAYFQLRKLSNSF